MLDDLKHYRADAFQLVPEDIAGLLLAILVVGVLVVGVIPDISLWLQGLPPAGCR